MFNIASLSDRGLKRDNNEDAIYVNNECGTFMVADGMGGHEKGEVASKIAIESFMPIVFGNLKHLPKNEDDTIVPYLQIEDELNECVNTATEKIISYSNNMGINGIMGTTIVGVKYLAYIRAWILFYLGDSRAYHFKNNSLLQLTTDHSQYEENGGSKKNIITKAIGNFAPYKLDIKYFAADPGDILLLCSDGVTDFCSNDELLLLIIRYRFNLNLLCEQIRSLVFARGANDNLSIIAIEIIEE